VKTGLRRTVPLAIVAFTGLACLQAQVQPQAPHYQVGWPCTGKERSFDPSYAKVAEATGGHLFLFDKSEVAGTSTLALGDMNHKQTVVRAAGKIDSYVDIPFWVDSSIDSLFIVASLQCMQTIYLYDPQRSSVIANQYSPPQSAEESKPGFENKQGEDAWFRAGRITALPHPQPGQWVLRLLGTGPYFVAIQAKTLVALGNVTVQDGTVSAWVDTTSSGVHERVDPSFQLVSATGDQLQPLNLMVDPSVPLHYEGRVNLPQNEFRVQVEWTTQSGARVQRTDPRLHDGRDH
jgi:hypothetical protein